MSIADRVPDYIRNLVPYAPGKPIEEVEREYGISGAAKLASNENPLGPSPKAIAALAARLNELNLYPDGDSFYLKAALARKLGVPRDHLIVGNGSNELIELAARTFMSPGDEAVVSAGTFVAYRLVLDAMGCVAKSVPLRHFAYDLDAMAKAITADTRCVFLANPNNPTGTIYGRVEWESFLESLPPEVLVVADEAYFEYVDEPSYPDSLEYHTEGRSILTLRTFSKIFGLAGLRIGYGVSDTDTIKLMNQVRQPFNVNAASQWAAVAAIDDVEHINRSIAVNRSGKEYLTQSLDELGVSYVAGHANFLLVETGAVAMVFERLLRLGVIVRPLGGDLPEHIRVTIGTQEENEKFIRALTAVRNDGLVEADKGVED